MKNEVASLMNNEELWYFLRKFYKVVRFADTIIIHSSSFIFHYSFIFLQQLQNDKFYFFYLLTQNVNDKRIMEWKGI